MFFNSFLKFYWPPRYQASAGMVVMPGTRFIAVNQDASPDRITPILSAPLHSWATSWMVISKSSLLSSGASLIRIALLYSRQRLAIVLSLFNRMFKPTDSWNLWVASACACICITDVGCWLVLFSDGRYCCVIVSRCSGSMIVTCNRQRLVYDRDILRYRNSQFWFMSIDFAWIIITFLVSTFGFLILDKFFCTIIHFKNNFTVLDYLFLRKQIILKEKSEIEKDWAVVPEHIVHKDQ